MAKIGLTKLGLTVPKTVKEVQWNDQTIEVKQYLPIKEKLDLCSKIINLSSDTNNFYNPGRVLIYETVEIILAYTNINVTAKQSEDIFKLYDLFNGNLQQLIYDNIPQEELKLVKEIVSTTIENIYQYKNSAVGIMSAIVDDYHDADLDATAIQKKLQNTENIGLVKDIMERLG